MSPVGHIVLLKAQNMAVPIFVDAIVAQSIHGALSGEKYPRPLTHDLMRSVLEGFDGKVSRVVITLKGGTYYADLHGARARNNEGLRQPLLRRHRARHPLQGAAAREQGDLREGRPFAGQAARPQAGRAPALK